MPCAGGWPYDPSRGWDYADKQQVKTRVAQELVTLVAGDTGQQRGAALDTRPFHGRCFSGLTPPGHPHYAGNFRGSDACCLRDCQVVVAYTDNFGFRQPIPGIAVAPVEVAPQMVTVSREVEEALNLAESLPPDTKLLHIVAAAARFLAEFLRVHPYANGNGHAARFGFWAGLLAAGFYPLHFSVDARPPAFDANLTAWRAGDPKPLETFILLTLASPALRPQGTHPGPPPR